MRIVLQRVSRASVDVLGEQTGRLDETFTPQHITQGYLLLVGVSDDDGQEQIDWLAHKIARLRLFEDEQGKTNLSIGQIGGQVLSISQFTLYADVRKGNRPSFIAAGKPDHAKMVWEGFNKALETDGLTVKRGRFGAHMRLDLVNDGPMTICMDTEQLMGH
ncbi:D-tyrosyl-tRNA(Tyr) deacylase [Bifidobacterium aemilianum]|uniref:D-aminoacyl-tRNA deacylase n=1 Tax=Bifidobacterium aemilianum TaxID=2493120 RepID=A0A366K9Y6_9BIFI|nr:D-aminoacyl-tRNA deacylase [Bifidobacterium aemilianum]RBP98546.1 D-tyrosyl-tRNA(Tyr) deacylase [Bifidobacterium aemilianum]